MKRYGLLISWLERNTQKALTIYKPIYSNDLKKLVDLNYKLSTTTPNYEDKIIEVKIFDYQEVHYISDKTINKLLLTKVSA